MEKKCLGVVNHWIGAMVRIRIRPISVTVMRLLHRRTPATRRLWVQYHKDLKSAVLLYDWIWKNNVQCVLFACINFEQFYVDSK